MEYNDKWRYPEFFREFITCFAGDGMNYGFLRVSAASPKVHPADCQYNIERIKELIIEGADNRTSLVVFPELCVTGITCGDLFFHNTLLESAENAVKKLLEETAFLMTAFVIGVPVKYGGKLYDCALFCSRGKVVGAVPKRKIKRHDEFSLAKYFSDGIGLDGTIDYADCKSVPLNPYIVFENQKDSLFSVCVDMGESLFSSIPNSEYLTAVGGAKITVCPSACAEIIGKADYRRSVVKSQSGRMLCGYIFTSASLGESTTDIVCAGHRLIAENGVIVTESELCTNGAVYGDLDLEKMESDRRKSAVFAIASDNIDVCVDRIIKKVYFSMDEREIILRREISRLPFIPKEENMDETCRQILTMQASALAVRMEHIKCDKLVIGLSGGLDSTLALIACVKACDMLGISRKNILTVTMPCFGTTSRTKSNAQKLAECYGTEFKEINISASVRQHFIDIGHDEAMRNVTYENSQARERTQVLMDLANTRGAIVVGTGDLSEIALGWATYNGDHMSMYAVNADIPKTLIRVLTQYESDHCDEELGAVLKDILDTPVSPELLPPSEDGEIAQKTEDVVGPYELHDFFLYYFVRYGFSPSKVFYLANTAFDGIYSEDTIKSWLKVFIRRFFTQQFKRSCMTDGPKIGSVSLSPRGDFTMPSDAAFAVWMEETEKL